jgi:hypothetical protein
MRCQLLVTDPKCARRCVSKTFIAALHKSMLLQMQPNCFDPKASGTHSIQLDLEFSDCRWTPMSCEAENLIADVSQVAPFGARNCGNKRLLKLL